MDVPLHSLFVIVTRESLTPHLVKVKPFFVLKRIVPLGLNYFYALAALVFFLKVLVVLRKTLLVDGKGFLASFLSALYAKIMTGEQVNNWGVWGNILVVPVCNLSLACWTALFDFLVGGKAPLTEQHVAFETLETTEKEVKAEGFTVVALNLGFEVSCSLSQPALVKRYNILFVSQIRGHHKTTSILWPKVLWAQFYLWNVLIEWPLILIEFCEV